MKDEVLNSSAFFSSFILHPFSFSRFQLSAFPNMPYNPNYPQDGQLIDATDFRTQVHGLFALIQAVPAGISGSGPSSAGLIQARVAPNWSSGESR